MSITTLATLRLVQFLHHDKIRLLMFSNDHLSDTLAIINHEILLREINQKDTHFTTIVRINGTWRVQYRQPVFKSKSATGTYLRLIALRQGNMQSRWYQTPLHRMKDDGLLNIRTKIHASTLWCRISG